jgi:hypothetical protein
MHIGWSRDAILLAFAAFIAMNCDHLGRFLRLFARHVCDNYLYVCMRAADSIMVSIMSD